MMPRAVPRPRLAAIARAVVIVIAAMASAACDPRDPESARLSDEERALIERIERDPFVRVIDRQRRDDGYLVVTTQQGDTRARYLLAPDSPASKVLKIRRMVEDFTIKVAPSDRLGTGAEPRGLSR